MLGWRVGIHRGWMAFDSTPPISEMFQRQMEEFSPSE